MTLRDWASSAIVASFVPRDREEVWQGVLRYLAWLEGLPITTKRVD